MAKKKTIRTIPRERTPMREQDPRARAKNFTEVACGYGVDEALREAERCLLCPEEPCVKGCPVGIDIPGFIRRIGGQVKFACVDGPDFDGHQVDFDDLMSRLRRYAHEERAAAQRWSENCRMKDLADALDPALELLELADPFDEVKGG